jgi:hypothetical protein
MPLPFAYVVNLCPVEIIPVTEHVFDITGPMERKTIT